MIDSLVAIRNLQRFIDAIDAGISIIDQAGDTVLFNAKLENILGYTLLEAQKINGLINLLSPKVGAHNALGNGSESYKIIQDPINEADRKIQSTQTIGLVPTKNGSAKSLIVSVSSLEFQNQAFQVNTYHDVSQDSKPNNLSYLLESVAIYANDAILITDADPFIEPGPRIVYANDAFTRMTGYSNSDILGHTPRILQGEKTDPRKKAKIRESLEQWKPVRTELINYKKDGTEFWVELNIVPVANSEGLYTHWISIQRDISEQKALEQALRDSQQQCNLAVVSGKMGLWDWDLKRETIQLDPSLQDMMGLENAEPIAIVQGWSQLVHPLDLDRVLVALHDHLSHETATLDVEYRMRHQNGQHLWVYTRGQAFWNDQGEAYRMLGINADITDRKQVELALTKSEQRFRQIFTEAPIGILQSDLQGQLIHVNPTLCRMLGYAAPELLSLNLKDITDLEAWKAEESHTQKKFRDDHSIEQCEKRYLKKNGDILWAQVTRGIMQLPDESNPVLIEMVQDVSERHQLEQMKDDFISIITHELRTPLTSLKGALSLLSTGKLGHLNDQGQRMLEFANTDTDLLIQLINDMLDFDRLKTGTLTMTPQICLTQELIDQVIHIVEPFALSENIQLLIESVEAPLWIDCDHIVQTLTNLIMNAIKFSSSGSQIWLQIKHQKEHLLFQVIDQGRGIPPDKLDTIFERFQQVDASDSRRRGGVGLGLAICKSIVQQHGGEIWADSIPNVGSTFNFTLPLSAEAIISHS